jgi:hypothetical protein
LGRMLHLFGACFSLHSESNGVSSLRSSRAFMCLLLKVAQRFPCSQPSTSCRPTHALTLKRVPEQAHSIHLCRPSNCLRSPLHHHHRLRAQHSHRMERLNHAAVPRARRRTEDMHKQQMDVPRTTLNPLRLTTDTSSLTSKLVPIVRRIATVLSCAQC